MLVINYNGLRSELLSLLRNVWLSYDWLNSVNPVILCIYVLLTSFSAFTVGNISRRVSLVHYHDPKELEKQEAEKKSKRLYQMSAGSSLINSSNHSGTPSQSSRLRNSHSSRGHPASTHSSRHRSSLSEVGEQSSAKKRKHKHGLLMSTDQSTLDSGRGHSGYTFSGSSEHSDRGRLKEEIKTE